MLGAPRQRSKSPAWKTREPWLRLLNGLVVETRRSSSILQVPENLSEPWLRLLNGLVVETTPSTRVRRRHKAAWLPSWRMIPRYRRPAPGAACGAPLSYVPVVGSG